MMGNKHIVSDLRQLSITCLLALSTISIGKAATLLDDAQWRVDFNNTFTYGLGMRGESIDPLIGNDPLQQNNEYKFSRKGDITTNRLSVLSELTASHNEEYGFRASASAWRDFAYDGGVKTNPLPGYAAVSSSPSGQYDNYTRRYYEQGGEILDAFGFWNTAIANRPVQFKLGRFAESWGNAIFSAHQAISTGQNPVDAIKGTAAPGTDIKELFIPRGTLSVKSQLSDTLGVGFQYHYEWRPSRFPEGGTFLGVTDATFIGPRSLTGIPRANDKDVAPKSHDFGVMARWSPEALDGTIGFYYREFSGTLPNAAAQFGPGLSDYHLSYPSNARMFAVSLDKSIAGVSAGFELSYVKNTGLNTRFGGNPAIDPAGSEGAQGDTLNVIANGIYSLKPNALWQTGTLTVELAWTRVLAVTHNPSMYYAIDYACSSGGLNPGAGRRDGCSTRDNLDLNLLFNPGWLQVFPGVDINAPVSISYGLLGNGQYLGTAGTGSVEGSLAYSIGVQANIRQKHQVKLTWTGYHSPTNGVIVNPLGQRQYASGSGQYMWNDKGFLSLVLSTSF